MILLIDNYDSFSYNLYQMVGGIYPEITVIRNNEMTAEEILALSPERIIISPGPGRPEDAGNIIEVVRTCGKSIPLLGVCLGHQAICAAFGARITYAKELMHGKQSVVRADSNSPLFAGCGSEFPVARYHSLAAEENSLPDELAVIARTLDGEIMAVSHRHFPIYGMQFHPESILTPDGERMLRNFAGDMRGRAAHCDAKQLL